MNFDIGMLLIIGRYDVMVKNNLRAKSQSILFLIFIFRIAMKWKNTYVTSHNKPQPTIIYHANVHAFPIPLLQQTEEVQLFSTEEET